MTVQVKLSSSERYEYKGNIYFLLNIIKVKNKQTREWEQFALYSKQGGTLYSRELKEFEERFKKI